MAIHFYEQDVKSALKQKRLLKAFLQQQILTQVGKPASINYIFMNDDALLAINKEYLQHDTYTDIITFDLSISEYELIADIFISIERVKENAEKFKITYEQELHRVIFHGALHLCGFKDKKPKEAALMRQMEHKWLVAYDL
jgi:probable rRNA maturation factor